MVDDELFADLKAVAGVPILVLGDDFQLPPVNGKASLMEGCDLKLTEVLRQAEGSPVIQLATHVRKYGCLPPDVVGYMDDERKCRITPKSLTESIRNGSYIDEWQIVCGTNNTRVHLNRVVRKELGYKGVCPMIGERIVITRNDTDIGVFNGQQFRVKDILLVDDELRYAFIHVVKVDSHFTRNLLIDLKALDGDGPDKDDPNFWRMRKARNEMIAHNCHHRLREDGVVPIGINTKLRVAEIDFAYALTVHKMQGSQSRNIVIVDQSYVFRDQASRWLYTGITRAVDKVHIFKRE
jgi:exodeoxyribonuclease-5